MTRRQWLALAATGAIAAEKKGRAPVSRENLIVKFPEAEAVKLSNGVTVIAVEDERLPVLTISFRTEGAGPIYAPRPGIAELTADLMKEGAGGRTGRQIVEEASRLGATFTSVAQGGAETAGVDGQGLTGRWSEWFELLCSLMLKPTFPADDLAQARQRWLVGVRARGLQASSQADDALTRLLFGNHPAAVSSPDATSLAALTPETLAAWHRERYTPSNTVLLAIGRVGGGAFRSRAEKLLGSWKGPEVKPTLPPNPQPAASRRIVLIDRPGAAQTELALGGLLFDRRDPDFFAVQIANAILGGGTGAWLYQSLREEKGYAYSAFSQVNTPRFTGFWRARAGVRTDATADSLAILTGHLRKLCDAPVPEADLEAAKRSVSGTFAINLEQPGNVLNLSYLRYRYGFSSDYWERYPARLNAVTASEVQAVAQKYLNPDRAHVVAVGDAAKIRPALAKLGTIEGAA
jgi:predicted Zn-dependent peptidase